MKYSHKILRSQDVKLLHIFALQRVQADGIITRDCPVTIV